MCGNSRISLKRNTKFVRTTTKPKKIVGRQMVKCNSGNLSSTDGTFVRSQADYIKDIVKVGLRENLTFDTFRSVRAKFVYRAFSTVPDGLVHVALLAQ